MSLAVDVRGPAFKPEPSKDIREAVAPSTPVKSENLSAVLKISPSSPLIDGYRQSTLHFSKSENKPKCEDVKNIETANTAIKSLSVREGASESVKERIKTRGRPKKQTFLYDVDQESSSSKKTQKSTKTARGRRAAPHARRSLSTSNLPADVKKEATLKPERKTANSVSPKKQLRSDDPQKPGPKFTSYQQTQLTGFGIRRTARQFAKDLKKQQEIDVVSAILNKEENGMKIVMTEFKGRGIISTRPFACGEFIVEYAGELISDSDARLREAEYKKNPDLGSYMFFFSYAGQRCCVDATEETTRLGRLINHSRLHPNCIVKVIPIGGVPRLTLFAKQDIPLGEELLYDYGDRGKESLIAHPWLKF